MDQKIINGFQIVHDLIKLRWVPEILKSIQLGNQRYNFNKYSLYKPYRTEQKTINPYQKKGY